MYDRIRADGPVPVQLVSGHPRVPEKVFVDLPIMTVSAWCGIGRAMACLWNERRHGEREVRTEGFTDPTRL